MTRQAIFCTIVASALFACGVGSGDNVVTASVALRNAPTDTTSLAVVYIGPSGCTGTLIAPNLVITAQHCVSPIVQTSSGECPVRFKEPLPNGLFVTATSPVGTATEGRHVVRDARVRPLADSEPNVLCGNDRALLILEDNVPASEAIPLSPRLESPVVGGETVSIVGYGVTGEEDAGVQQAASTRRRIDRKTISCLGTTCPRSDVTANEFMSDSEVCAGDSGGPVLDSSERVVGIVSRSNDRPCGANVVAGGLYEVRSWISEVAREAASEGSYPPPTWIVRNEDAGVTTRADGSTDAASPSVTSTTSGCVASGRRASGAGVFVWFAVASLIVTKRRSLHGSG